MGRGIIALYTLDLRYANAFVDYCSSKEKERLSVKAFTNGESLDNYLSRHSIDILLVDNQLYKDISNKYLDKLVILSEDKYINSEEVVAVYKYQRIDLVFKQIYLILAGKNGTVKRSYIAYSSQVEIIGVFSPCFCKEREQFARLVAKVYGNNNKVLFINLAELSANDISGEDGISELLYYIQDEDKSISYKLQTLVVNNGNYVSLPGVKHYRDLQEMNSDNVERLIGQLRQEGSYKKIVIDIGFLNDAALSIVLQCNKVWLPVNGDISNDCRMKHMWHDFELEGRNTISEVLTFTELPKWWNERDDMRQPWVDKLVNGKAD